MHEVVFADWIPFGGLHRGGCSALGLWLLGGCRVQGASSAAEALLACASRRCAVFALQRHGSRVADWVFGALGIRRPALCGLAAGCNGTVARVADWASSGSGREFCSVVRRPPGLGHGLLLVGGHADRDRRWDSCKSRLEAPTALQGIREVGAVSLARSAWRSPYPEADAESTRSARRSSFY